MGTDDTADREHGVAITGNEVITLELKLDDVVFIVSGLRDLADQAKERMRKSVLDSEMYWIEYRVWMDNQILAYRIVDLYVNQLSAEK